MGWHGLEQIQRGYGVAYGIVSGIAEEAGEAVVEAPIRHDAPQQGDGEMLVEPGEVVEPCELLRVVGERIEREHRQRLWRRRLPSLLLALVGRARAVHEHAHAREGERSAGF